MVLVNVQRAYKLKEKTFGTEKREKSERERSAKRNFERTNALRVGPDQSTVWRMGAFGSISNRLNAESEEKG